MMPFTKIDFGKFGYTRKKNNVIGLRTLNEEDERMSKKLPHIVVKLVFMLYAKSTN